MMIIDGKKEAENLRQEIKKEIDVLKSKNNKVPGLTVILILALMFLRNFIFEMFAPSLF